ncbi:T9SS type A sorting domain-containing protein [Flavobacterium paronense]|uniref:T9SS type A sorting domain-containing protein n=1 Tax=Flavobacterium paronense TaxID=1392775 RepID=A0ABV5GDP4_9FLAO|nr:T9SS type A sorting domain-containing protein [Flavobacterium paronense]MDN3677997.1 T9SS type A sorting domain-containing protein [Flavobacterium paronense]
MKKIVFLLLCLLLNFTPSIAQIFVKDNTLVYNKGSVVYSTGNIDLNGVNSKFYLRNEGQFVQGTTGLSTNTGLGELSVYQEGTVNNFSYNYWCSPVGIQSATIPNQEFGITMLKVPTTNIASNSSTASTSYNGFSSAGALAIAPFWIFKYTTDTSYSGWVHAYSNTTIKAGEGFTMKGTSGSDGTDVGEKTTLGAVIVNNPGSAQRYDFRGRPNDGNITVGVGLDKFTLTGNPYPSALDVSKFLLDSGNTDIVATAYYWEQDKTVNSHLLLAYQGGYGTFAPGTGAPGDFGVYTPPFFVKYDNSGNPLATPPVTSPLTLERRYAPIGQGFLVKGKATGSPTSVTIKNAHREYYKESGTYSDFEKQWGSSSNHNQDVGINTISHIRLNIIVNNSGTRQIALTFFPTATDDVDRGIDGLSPDIMTRDAYFFLNNERYVIEGISFDENKRVPLGVDATDNTSFKFSLAQLMNFDEAQPIYIYDDLDGSYHNLKDGDYEVTVPTGIYNNRFQMTFKDSTLGIPSLIKESIMVVQNNTSQLLTVLNPNLMDINKVTIYDIAGKLLLNNDKLQAKASYEFSTASYSTGVYLVKLQTVDGKSKVQKIIIDSK